MALPRIHDRLGETSTTTGTGTLTLGGALTGYRAFSTVGNSNKTFYLIDNSSAGEWETGIGTYTSSGTTLSRDKVLASSNSGSAVNFSAGTKSVYGNAPAAILQPSHAVCGGRLTLTTGTPVTTTDVTGATTIYFTPTFGEGGTLIGVPNGYGYDIREFSELSLALGTLTSGANYDVFLYDVSGTLTLILGPAWSSNTSRGTGGGTTELQVVDGMLTNAVSISGGPGAGLGRYLGTLRTTSTTATEDSVSRRFVWNLYNQAPRKLRAQMPTNSWSDTAVTWHTPNSNTTVGEARLELLIGYAGIGSTHVRLAASGGNGAAFFAANIGIDSTTAASGDIWSGSTAAAIGVVIAFYDDYISLGYHYLQHLEGTSSGTTTWYGDNGSTYIQSGMSGHTWG